MKKITGFVLGAMMALSLFGLGYANGKNKSFELTTEFAPRIIKSDDLSLREKTFYINYYLEKDIKR